MSLSRTLLSDNRSGKPALTAERVVARLRFFPLLIGRIEIADITAPAADHQHRLQLRPQFELVGARRNATSATCRPNNAKRRRSPRSASKTEPSFCATTPRIVATPSSVELALAWPSISKSFAATGRFSWHNEKIDATISSPTSPQRLGHPLGLKVRLAGTPLKFGFDGYLGRRPVEDRRLARRRPHRCARRSLGGRAAAPGGGFGRFALQGADQRGRRFDRGFRASIFELDGNSGEGVLALTTDGRKTLQGTLATELLDLNPYVSTVRLMASGDRRARSRQSRSPSRGSIGSISIFACRPARHRQQCQARPHRRSPPTCAAIN